LELTVSSTAEAYAQFPELPIEILRQRTLGGGLIEFSLGTGALGVPGGSEGTSAIASINIPLHPVAIAGYIGLVVNALALLPTRSEYNTFGLRVFHVVVISPLMDPCFCSSQRRTVAAKV